MNFDRVAACYEVSRVFSKEAQDDWRRALARYLPPADRRPILDLGSGTGQFTAAFAEWFETEVFGVEPSRAMREIAETKRSHRLTRYLAGSAESIPLPDRSCGAAWISAVIHHVPDLQVCALELSRVLVPGARVLIRNAFPGGQHEITLFKFFPEAGDVVDTFPTVASTVGAFARAGFSFERVERVAQRSAPNLEAIRKVVGLRADTTLASLSDEVFARGLRALDAEIRARPGRGPIVDCFELLVLRLDSQGE
jgi:ubiquinone/menaquinone biosynthesis C-methylase UbiE